MDRQRLIEQALHAFATDITYTVRMIERTHKPPSNAEQRRAHPGAAVSGVPSSAVQRRVVRTEPPTFPVFTRYAKPPDLSNEEKEEKKKQRQREYAKRYYQRNKELYRERARERFVRLKQERDAPVPECEPAELVFRTPPAVTADPCGVRDRAREARYRASHRSELVERARERRAREAS